jgi:hypothetical protein
VKTGRTIRALRVRRIVVASIAAAALLTSAACGGGSEEAGGSEKWGPVEHEVWRADICTALREWITSWRSLSREFADEGLVYSSGEEAKTALVTFVTGLLDETDVMLKKVDAAGTPAGERGEEVRRAFRNAFGQMRRVIADALAEVQNLPTRSVSAFNSEAEALARSAELAYEEVGRQFSDLQYLEFNFEGELPEACQGGLEID